jgi:hypothetical protein
MNPPIVLVVELAERLVASRCAGVRRHCAIRAHFEERIIRTVPSVGCKKRSPTIVLSATIFIAEDDMVCLRWSSTMRQTGKGLGVPKTNRTVRITGMSVVRIAGGKFVAGGGSDVHRGEGGEGKWHIA